MEKLTKKEMKLVTGGVGIKYVWHCRDTPSLPYMTAGTCSSNDPAVFCGEYSCINSGVECTGGEFCP
ncbi:hypothetical protein [Mucilaginibacter sp.]|uniref:hypothetical protein n=1 Tax=Mucilaginibacter sp. TaxID=1882438 RepID=UPI002628B5C1|nr:hypothetical protein [Mucilaginibacter sp.]MDB4918413.1 hypothetical protein [Mucilaginibacter sp.]